MQRKNLEELFNEDETEVLRSDKIIRENDIVIYNTKISKTPSFCKVVSTSPLQVELLEEHILFRWHSEETPKSPNTILDPKPNELYLLTKEDEKRYKKEFNLLTEEELEKRGY